MNIHYEENENGESRTPCPNKKRPIIFNGNDFESKIKVNSSTCKRCKYYEGKFFKPKFIECSYPQSIEVKKVYYTLDFDIPQGIDKNKLIKKDSQHNLKKKPRFAYIEIDGKRIYLGK